MTINSLTLAPMEGVVDHAVRALLSDIGGFDLCVTEFLRVSQGLLPARSFYRLAPELQLNKGHTPSGTKIRVQLLGNQPSYLAENAYRAIELGSHGVDLNFGCPAKTVNNSKGGAVLLQEPETLYQIIKAVREAVPREHIVSAKIRLGYENSELFEQNVQAVVEAGASELAIHARTKQDGYKPPAYWSEIKKILPLSRIPIIANGEVWTRQDAFNCIAKSGCNRLMTGRGVLAMPNLAQVIKHNATPYTWAQAVQVLIDYSEHANEQGKGLYYANRVKQWLKYLKISYPQASELLQQIRKLNNKADILKYLQSTLATRS
ncbi:tRNA-dihydrouridine synthase [Gayadomonas joobiniege]|uniref:tRNA-dihydrouridine synthase n=1 Tax=Gayadomonas joobiniege TaxID=1234606 RepID=UPI00036B740B|nr:tRNA-dihydrouridine synthase [Gayadomonas joobiniege]